jgi:hypothetical protein
VKSKLAASHISYSSLQSDLSSQADSTTTRGQTGAERRRMERGGRSTARSQQSTRWDYILEAANLVKLYFIIGLREETCRFSLKGINIHSLPLMEVLVVQKIS